MALRVLFLSWRDQEHPEAGGAEAFLDNVSQLLCARGHEVTIFTAAYEGAAAAQQSAGRAYVRRGRRYSVYPRGAAHLLSHGGDYDVIVDIQNGVPFWAPAFSRTPVVNLVHHVHREQWPEVFGPVRSRIGWWLESRVAPRVYRSSHYLVVSRATRDDLAGLGVDVEQVSVVYSGKEEIPDLSHLPRTSDPSIVVLGRLVPHKRVELALRAVAELRHRRPGLTLDVVGHGYWEPELRAEAARLGIEDAVRFLGFVDDADKQKLLATTWLNLLPSLKEGWGLAIVEAAAHGTPSVAFSTAGGTTESVLDGLTGRLVSSDDEFVTVVDELLGDTVARSSMGVAARVHATSFSWEATADAVEQVLGTVVGRPRGPAMPAQRRGLGPRARRAKSSAPGAVDQAPL